jgi:hypothetical protein
MRDHPHDDPRRYSKMDALARGFPSLRLAKGVDPWDPVEFLRWFCESGAPGHGAHHAVHFVLGVWNSDANWRTVANEHGIKYTDKLRPFDVFDALSTWDDDHRRAFAAWVNNPFFV